MVWEGGFRRINRERERNVGRKKDFCDVGRGYGGLMNKEKWERE